MGFSTSGFTSFPPLSRWCWKASSHPEHRGERVDGHDRDNGAPARRLESKEVHEGPTLVRSVPEGSAPVRFEPREWPPPVLRVEQSRRRMSGWLKSPKFICVSFAEKPRDRQVVEQERAKVIEHIGDPAHDEELGQGSGRTPMAGGGCRRFREVLISPSSQFWPHSCALAEEHRYYTMAASCHQVTSRRGGRAEAGWQPRLRQIIVLPRPTVSRWARDEALGRADRRKSCLGHAQDRQILSVGAIASLSRLFMPYLTQPSGTSKPLADFLAS